MNYIYASIITIGDELLIGQVIDSNSAWMAQRLNSIGVLVKRRVSVGDNRSDIQKALDEESRESQVLLITGGLGPTADDITKPVLCDYFDGKMIVDEGALQNVKDIFARLNRPLIDRNLKQAEVPDTCQVILNKRGTAPGMQFEKNGVVFVSMPGVPHEMKGMMDDHVLPMINEKFRLPAIVHETLLTSGIGESQLADHIQSWEEQLPENIKLAYLPNYGMVRLRLTAIGPDALQLEAQVAAQFEKLQVLVKEWLVTNKDETITETLLQLLKSKGKTMATAESCTGGYMAHLITSIPGSSAAYWGSIVSYDNSVKEKMLGVPAEILAEHGAVSELVVMHMLQGALEKLGTDYAVAVSGIMGPDGGSEEKPVGTVWVAAGNKQQVKTQLVKFRFDRRRNIEMTAAFAMNLLRKFVLETEG